MDLKRILTISIGMILMSANLFAANFEYQISGNYNLPNRSNKKVNYTLNWTEDKGDIKGEYYDSFFTTKGIVSGKVGKFGRNFTVTLPIVSSGVKSINLLTSQTASTRAGIQIPVSVVTRGPEGNPLTNISVNSQFMALAGSMQAQEARPCFEGFGELNGFCGNYAGLITEESDNIKKCNLENADAIRLELDDRANVLIHLGLSSEVVVTPTHIVGRIPSDPKSSTIDVMSRSCRPIPGVNFAGDNCKRLNLKGQFTLENKSRRHFKGTYTITDERTNNFCRYSISMDRD